MKLHLLSLIGLLLFSPNLSQADQKLDQELLKTVTVGAPPQRKFDFERFKELIEQGANVNVEDLSGKSPLNYITANHGYLMDTDEDRALYLEAAKIIVAHGADVNHGSLAGVTPLMSLIGASYHPPQVAPRDVHPMINILKSSKEHPFKINATTITGNTVAYYATRTGDIELMKEFVSEGLQLNSLNELDESVFFLFVRGGGSLEAFKKMLDLLSESQRVKMIQQATKSGTSLLMQAVRQAKFDIAQYIIDNYNININAQHVEGHTALDFAYMYKDIPRTSLEKKSIYKKIIQFLKAHGAQRARQPESDILYCHQSNSEPFSFVKARDLINKCRLQSVDELLPLLPKSFKSNYALAYKGRGIQGSSKAFPRVISVGAQMNSIISIAGHNDMMNGNTIEFLEYKNKTSKYELREITFENNGVKLSEANPAKCLACHGQNPRPLWESWFLWPGFYNSEQSFMFPKERTFYTEFLKNRNTGRYKNFLELSDSPVITEYGYEEGPNVTGILKIEVANFYTITKFIMGDIKSNTQLTAFRPAILAALNCPDPIENFVPEKIQNQFKTSVKEYLQDIIKQDYKEGQDRIQRQIENLEGPPQGDYAHGILNNSSGQYRGFNYARNFLSRLRYLIENQGIQINWGTHFKNDYSYFHLTQLESVAWKELLSKKDPQEAELINLYEERWQKVLNNQFFQPALFQGSDNQGTLPGVDTKPLCTRLKKLSLQRLSHL